MSDFTAIRLFAPKQGLKAWQVSYLIVVTLVFVTWLKQDRLSDYWQQTYQSNSVWDRLNTLPNWQQGKALSSQLNPVAWQDWLSSVNRQANGLLNNQLYADFLYKQQQRLQHQAEQAKLMAAQAKSHPQPNSTTANQLVLALDKQVFFAGDSMMQGIAPWVMRKLQSDHGINSINLSKQSTGLSYSSFFDWPATIESTLNEHPDIGTLVVFLGPNDPWAVPDPLNKGGQYIEFGTPRWNALYREKIQRILAAANQHQVQVLWVTPPSMRKPKLDQQMAQLQQIIHQSIEPSQALVLDSRQLLQPGNSGYRDSLSVEGKITKLRSADGIHFTSDGQKLIADAIVSHFNINNPTSQ